MIRNKTRRISVFLHGNILRSSKFSDSTSDLPSAHLKQQKISTWFRRSTAMLSPPPTPELAGICVYTFTVSLSSGPHYFTAMANLVRLAKSGSDWGPNELLAYNISIVEEDQQTFFSGPLPHYTGPASFAQHEDRVQGLDAPSLALVKRLYLAMKVIEGEQSAVNDFYFGTFTFVGV